MKIREGFVSNSSSSSFVVIFDEPVRTPDDIFKKVFGGVKGQKFKNYECECSAEEISLIIFNEMQSRDLNEHFSTAVEILSNASKNDYARNETHCCLRLTKNLNKPEIPSYHAKTKAQEKKLEKQWDEYYEKLNAASEKELLRLIGQKPGRVVYTMHFQDYGAHSLIEETNFFKEMPSVKLNGH